MSFLNEDFKKGTDWKLVERTISRVMSHCGWKDVRLIGETGDCGGDILGVRQENGKKKVYVIQSKAITGGNYLSRKAIEEVKDALSVYAGDVGIVATNGHFSQAAYDRRDELRKIGFDIRLWNGKFFEELLDKWPEGHHERAAGLRPYQRDIVDAALRKHSDGGRSCQFIVATGLGKTVIAAEILSRIMANGPKKALVLCHQRDLALQLEQSFWRQIGKSIPTRTFFDGIPPKPIFGVNFGLYQTFSGYLSGTDVDAYDVVIVDEAHHAMAHGFRQCLKHIKPSFLIGMTATPWRGDGADLDDLFGPPIAKVSLVDGMQMGYLSKVDYRFFHDTIQWDLISQKTLGAMTINDLNKRLFIPQRDEAVISQLKRITSEVKNPQGIIFASSVEHSKRFSDLMSVTAPELACKNLSGIDKRDRQRILNEFGAGKIPFISAVDILNEGIDVPNVNIIAFLRTTHSRRIFVQQIGRGLRIAHGKEKVIVADFVSDIRRIADVMEMDKQSRTPQSKYCTLTFDAGIVNFQGGKPAPFVNKWLQDVTDLGDTDESHRLKFPENL